MYRYPTRVVVRDYLLSGAGLGLFLPPLALMSLPLLTELIFSALGVLFLVFGFQVMRRHRTRIELKDDGLMVAPGKRELRWGALSKLALSYFALRRDGERGWMELKIGSKEQSIRVDSRLEGFDEITCRAVQAATENGIELDKATITNLAALGIDLLEVKRADADAE